MNFLTTGLTVETADNCLLCNQRRPFRTSRCVKSNNIFPTTPVEFQHIIWHFRIPWSQLRYPKHQYLFPYLIPWNK